MHLNKVGYGKLCERINRKSISVTPTVIQDSLSCERMSKKNYEIYAC